MHQQDELLSFAKEEHKGGNVSANQEPIQVLIVDDDQSVHEVTRFALKGYTYQGHPLHFLSALSAEQAIEILRVRHKNIEVILLDMVMEHQQAGLDVVHFFAQRIAKPPYPNRHTYGIYRNHRRRGFGVKLRSQSLSGKKRTDRTASAQHTDYGHTSQ